MKRRDFITGMGAVSLATLTVPHVYAAESCQWHLSKEDSAVPGLEVNAPVKRITGQPKCHWHAYYDQVQFSSTGRYVIANEVDFEHRSPMPNDWIRLGLIDTEDNNRWIPIGKTCSWNWQLGCMFQFIPGTDTVIWNELKGADYISRIYDIPSGKTKELPGPCYALSSDGKFTVCPDFRRLGDTRPGYGYCCVPDPNGSVMIPQNAGIWKMDLDSGERKLLFSFADIANIPEPGGFPENVKHWFNHLIVAPDCKRFLFLHRWQRESKKLPWYTRMCTANATDGSDVFIVNHHPMTSHLFWRDSNHIVAYAHRPQFGNQVYLFEDKTDQFEVYGKNSFNWGDTHISYIPHTNNKWVLNDSYPVGKERLQTVFLYNVDTGEKIILGRFPSPKEYKGEWRTDLHPTCSRDGRTVMIDTCCFGGRQICLIDLRPFIK